MTGEELLKTYIHRPGFWDEMFSEDQTRPEYRLVRKALALSTLDILQEKDRLAGELFLSQGITFTVYGQQDGTERIFPYDLIPRLITAAEWATLERGLTQRITALNLFLHDLYGPAKVLADLPTYPTTTYQGSRRRVSLMHHMNDTTRGGIRFSQAFGATAGFSDATLARAMVLTVNTWLGYPYMMILAMGLLKAIPEDLYEASALAGAGPLTNLFRITLPLVMANAER